jgi:hypothetical protein
MTSHLRLINRIAMVIFSSNRDYGKGDDDIYSYKKSGNQLISGKVDGKSKVGIENVSVKVYYNLDDLVAETTTDVRDL